MLSDVLTSATAQAEEAELAVAAAAAVDSNASFGIDEGEVDQLEKKWITWSYDVEENKRLVLDEVDDIGATPQRLSVWNTDSPRGHFGGSRARRRTPWGERIVKASPVYYGWVVAGLVAVCALIVSPAQVYCVGAVVDIMIINLGLTRLEISSVYGTAALLSAPLITLHPLLLARISRRLLITLCGAGVCGGLLLVSFAVGRLTLLIGWTLLLAVGPGMLYPAAEAVLLDWWHAKRARVQVGVNALAGVLGIIALPALVTAAAACPGCGASPDEDACSCWRGAYSALGALLAVPVAALSALFLEGGAADHDLRLDDEQGSTSLIAAAIEEEARARDGIELSGSMAAAGDEPPPAAAAAAATDGVPKPPPLPMAAQRGHMRAKRGRRHRSLKELWALHDILTHTTFWLAQLSISTVQALVAAFLFHRAHIAATHFTHQQGRALSADAPATPHEAAATPADGLPIELLVGIAAVCCSPLSLLLQRKEILVLLAMGLATAGMLLLASSSSSSTLQLVALLLGAAFGVTNAYATTLWEYFYGDGDAHRIKQISVAISTGTRTQHHQCTTTAPFFTSPQTASPPRHSTTRHASPRAHATTPYPARVCTAASGVAIWLFAVSWHRNGSYHSALVGAGLICLSLGALDLAALAKPEVLESVVRRAPTWEQLVAFRQRQKHFSTRHAAKKRAARLASKLRARGFGRGVRAADTAQEHTSQWMDATLEPSHQANPIERELAAVDESPPSPTAKPEGQGA